MAVKAPTILRVTRRFTKAGKEVKEGAKDQDEVLDVRVFQTVPAEVSLTFGLTVNLRNFEGARVDVGLKLPCYAEEVDDAYVHVEKWVTERVQREAHEAREYAKRRDRGE